MFIEVHVFLLEVKHQDIIVKFKSHAARYKFFNHKKSLKNNKVHSNLTPKRSKLLFDARSVIERFGRVHFVFADIIVIRRNSLARLHDIVTGLVTDGRVARILVKNL